MIEVVIIYIYICNIFILLLYIIVMTLLFRVYISCFVYNGTTSSTVSSAQILLGLFFLLNCQSNVSFVFACANTLTSSSAPSSTTASSAFTTSYTSSSSSPCCFCCCSWCYWFGGYNFNLFCKVLYFCYVLLEIHLSCTPLVLIVAIILLLPIDVVIFFLLLLLFLFLTNKFVWLCDAN